jgi:hypothetical protein
MAASTPNNLRSLTDDTHLKSYNVIFNHKDSLPTFSFYSDPFLNPQSNPIQHNASIAILLLSQSLLCLAVCVKPQQLKIQTPRAIFEQYLHTGMDKSRLFTMEHLRISSAWNKLGNASGVAKCSILSI